jgi:tRNA-2-methylthio-N6-dimethylallyladenosine synthase
VDFADLLYMVAEVDGIERIRFQTSHPAGFSRKVVDALKNIDKVCPYVHLPPQSGSDRVLRRMNRGYTRQEYIEKVEMLRSEVPEVVLSGDFIVGFPGETEEDFEETLSLVKVCAFHKGFVFKFSPRPLTEASKLPDDVPEDVKNRRLRQLQELLKSQALAGNCRLVGRTVKVLIERDNPKGSGLYGRTPGNEPVIVEGEPELKGKVVNVRITDATPFFLRGRVIPSKECGHGGSLGNRHNAG